MATLQRACAVRIPAAGTPCCARILTNITPTRQLCIGPKYIQPHLTRNNSVVASSSIRSAPAQQGKSTKQHSSTLTAPPRSRSPTPLDVEPATSCADLTPSVQQLVEIIEQGFEQDGKIKADAHVLATKLRTSLSRGLPEAVTDAALRRQMYGRNKLPAPQDVSFLDLVADALQDPTVMLLMASGGVSLALAATMGQDAHTDWIEGAAILASVLIVVGVGATTNYQKEHKFRQLNALKADVPVRVVRGGVERTISTYDLLVGDVVVVESGDIIPADGVLVEGEEMKLDQSHMTGESDDVVRSPRDAPLLLSGSKVLEGYGRMLVLAVGSHSQQGILASLVMGTKDDDQEEVQEGSSSSGADGACPAAAAAAAAASSNGKAEGAEPAAAADGAAASSSSGSSSSSAFAAAAASVNESLQEDTFLMQKLGVLAEQIGNVGIWAAAGVLLVNAATFTLQLLAAGGVPWELDAVEHYLDFFITSITILVVAVPEGLPLAVTLALAFSVQRMLADNNLVRHLDACETMACATTICSDKTGTLTQNNMTVVRLWTGAGQFHVRASRSGRARQLPEAADSDEAAAAGASGADGHHFIEAVSLSFDGPDIVGSNGVDGQQPRPQLAVSLPPRVQQLLLDNIVLNSTANVSCSADGTGSIERAGNRTECALLEFALRLGYGEVTEEGVLGVGDLRSRADVVQLLPFTSHRKRMSVLVRLPQGQEPLLDPTTPTPPLPTASTDAPGATLLTKGAVEVVVERCSHQLDASGTVVPLSQAEKERLLGSLGEASGLRLLALAYRDVPVPSAKLPADELERDLVLLGVVGMEDPLREDVPVAIAQCQRAGIVVRMLTGDNARTATSIARQCGILPADTDIDSTLTASSALTVSSVPALAASASNASVFSFEFDSSSSSSNGAAAAAVARASAAAVPEHLVLEGPQFRRLVHDAHGHLDLEAFRSLWPRLRVLARCSPSDKFLLVTALKKLRQQEGPAFNEVVAMTGDGTNDAPALTAADVGFAMNSGTSIAKDAADILLMDDSFSSIVSAVKWGRNVYASVTKFLQFQLTANVVAVATACAGAVALHESPLSAVQMLWVNLIMDSLASLALATESPTDEMLDQAPCAHDQPLIDDTMAKHILGQASYQLVVLGGLVFYGGSLLGVDDDTKNTLVFNAFVLMQLFNQLNCRKVRDDEPNILAGLASHPAFCAILGSELLFQWLIVQHGGDAFQTVPLSAPQWALCTGLGATTLLVRAGLRQLPSPPIGQTLGAAVQAVKGTVRAVGGLWPGRSKEAADS